MSETQQIGLYLDMCLPCVFRGRHRPHNWVVHKLGILAQPSPETESLTCIVALVDQVALGWVGAVRSLEGLGGPLPRLGLETAILAQAELDALA